MMFLWSIYSVFYTPFAFCFFRGIPEHLLDLECVQLIFLADVAVHFFLAYRDPHTHRVVYDQQRIALRSELTSHSQLKTEWQFSEFLKVFLLFQLHQGQLRSRHARMLPMGRRLQGKLTWFTISRTSRINISASERMKMKLIHPHTP